MISLIAALDRNRGIGKNNKLPWHLPEDLKHFKETTKGHPVIMGRKTFESIGRPLPNRTNIVVTRNEQYSPENVVVKHSLEEAIEYSNTIDTGEVFVIGGQDLFNQAIKIADRLYITRIDAEFHADTWFPEYEKEFTRVISEKPSQNADYNYSFIVLERGN